MWLWFCVMIFKVRKRDIFREGSRTSHLIKMRDRSTYWKHAEYFSGCVDLLIIYISISSFEDGIRLRLFLREILVYRVNQHVVESVASGWLWLLLRPSLRARLRLHPLEIRIGQRLLLLVRVFRELVLLLSWYHGVEDWLVRTTLLIINKGWRISVINLLTHMEYRGFLVSLVKNELNRLR